MSDLLNDIWNEIKPAYIEISLVIAVFNVLVSSQEMVALSNMLSNSQISLWGFLIRFVFQFILVPALPSIVIGWTIHKIRGSRKKRRSR